MSISKVLYKRRQWITSSIWSRKSYAIYKRFHKKSCDKFGGATDKLTFKITSPSVSINSSYHVRKLKNGSCLIELSINCKWQYKAVNLYKADTSSIKFGAAKMLARKFWWQDEIPRKAAVLLWRYSKNVVHSVEGCTSLLYIWP